VNTLKNQIGRSGESQAGGDPWFWPGALCAAVIVGVVIFEMLVPISPDPYWSGDPRVQTLNAQVTEITPITSVVMNMGVILVAFAGLVAHWLKGGRLSAWVLWPAALGGLAALYVGVQEDEAVRAVGWAAGAFGAASVWHLAQRAKERALVTGAVVGACLLVAMKTGMYVLVEFPSGQEFLRTHMTEIFQARGWTADSAQAQAYLRRASQLEATGSYGLSNVFGSLMAALAFVGAGLAAGVWKKAGGARAWLVALAAVGALACVVGSFSKGSMVALAGVVGFAAVAWGVMKYWPKRPIWLVPAGAVLLLVMGFGVVMVRGAVVGPPATIQGERSLLFRYHYWVGAARLAKELPAQKLVTGISQEGFRNNYPRVKVPINPEEVASTHNFWIDYTLMLGVGGAAWSLLLVGWGVRGVAKAQRVSGEGDGLPAAEGLDRPGLRVGGLLAVGVFVPIYWHQQAMMLPETLLMLFVGLGGLAVVAAVVTTPGWVDRMFMSWGLALGGLVLLFQGQIEMTFSTSGAMALGWLIVALAGSDDAPDGEKVQTGIGTWLGALAGVALVVGASTWLSTRGMAIVKQQRLLEQAAKTLPKDFGKGTQLLSEAVEAYPYCPRPARNLIDLASEAGEGLGRAGDKERAAGWFAFGDKVLAGLPEIVKMGPQVTRSESRMRFAQHQVTGDANALAEAKRLLERAVAGSPYDRTLREDLARLCEAQGDKTGAKAAYRESLRLSDVGYLDETRVYTPEQKAQIEAKIRALE
jgi:hypothetical protein